MEEIWDARGLQHPQKNSARTPNHHSALFSSPYSHNRNYRLVTSEVWQVHQIKEKGNLGVFLLQSHHVTPLQSLLPSPSTCPTNHQRGFSPSLNSLISLVPPCHFCAAFPCGIEVAIQTRILHRSVINCKPL